MPQAGGTVRVTSSGASTGSAQDTVLVNALIRLLAQKSAGGNAPSLGSRTINQTPTARQTGTPGAQTRQPAAASTATPWQTARLTSTVTATATFTPTGAGRAVPLATQPPAPGAPLEFTRDDIEYAPSAPRTGDRKIQLTIRLKPKGGMPPLGFLLDGTTQVDGLTFTFDWHNCGESEPHTIMILSADGQKSQPVEFIYPFACR
jgi:hypothetical protein